MSASPFPSPRRRRVSVLVAALAALAALLTSARPSSAADEAVQISCPDLTTEQTAEIESRIRASLLTTEVADTVAVACRSDGADVRVERAPESVLISAPTSPATFRDDVLRIVEQALEELRRRQAAAPQASTRGLSSTTAPEPAAPATLTPPPVMAPPASPPTSAPPSSARARTPAVRAWTEISGAFASELWRDQAALGATLGVRHRNPALWYGLQVAVLRPASQASAFNAVEAHASVELSLQPRFGAGLRLTLGLGPSVLFVEPQGQLTARTGTAKTSLFAAAHLSRAFWLGHWALLPDLGVRLFARERGVSIDGQEQLVLGGFALQASAGVAYRVD